MQYILPSRYHTDLNDTRLSVRNIHRLRMYTEGKMKPNYPLPVKLDVPTDLIASLWLASKYGKQERTVRRWYLATR